MKYESQKTPRGNIGVSFESQAAADAQAAAMDAGRNNNCYNCSDCSYCSLCSYCSDCSLCSYCSYCSDCSLCSYCSSVLGWRGPKAEALLSLNGLRWPVAVSDTYMQIGCESHTHAKWAKFSKKRIALMDDKAAAFWTAHKDRLLALCSLRADMDKARGA